ncbi:MAG: zinc ribbon domain-containing protein [Planctomycetota bacterium]|nr:zinc ribbon domain-containing protein [Planctomycetota bacterium]
MPTYDYVCAACDHAFEHFQSMTSRRLRKCPACGKPKLDRLVGSGSGVIFKGSGFYETDYKRSGSTSSSKDTKSDAGESKSKASESKKSDKGAKGSKASGSDD